MQVIHRLGVRWTANLGYRNTSSQLSGCMRAWSSIQADPATRLPALQVGCMGWPCCDLHWNIGLTTSPKLLISSEMVNLQSSAGLQMFKSPTPRNLFGGELCGESLQQPGKGSGRP